MGLKPEHSDPPIVKYAKWGFAVVSFLAVLWATGTATIVSSVRWAARPIVEAEAAARVQADSTMYEQFVSRLERMDHKQNQLAIALTYPEGSRERNRMLRSVLGIRRFEVDVPEEIQATENGKQ